jgi:hypothetical protein
MIGLVLSTKVEKWPMTGTHRRPRAGGIGMSLEGS